MRPAVKILVFSVALLPVHPVLAEPKRTMSAEELRSISAGEAPQVNVATRQNIDALSAGNQITADTVTSGNVNFTDGAFGNFNGIGNVVINTGNNNAIQGTLSVTVVGVP